MHDGEVDDMSGAKSKEEIIKYLESELGIPGKDAYNLPTSERKFPDGAHYRIEVPTINSIEAMRMLLEKADDFGLVINRIDETRGIMRHTDKELEEMIELAKEYKLELNLSHGPRAKYDTSATALTPMGAFIGYRLRGSDSVVNAVEDIKRGIELGCRGFLVYDEGLLYVLGQMRKDGILSRAITFKLSAHCGHGNPAAFRLLAKLGADSINPTRDLSLPMISAIRQAVEVPIDIHCDNPVSSGGFIRTYEAPEFVRIGAPIHLKCGNSAVTSHGVPTTPQEGANMATQACLVWQTVQKYYPAAIQSKPGAKGLSIPV